MHFELVLLGLRERVANFAAGRILRARHAASGVRHLLFEVFQLVGHLALFLGQTIELLLGLSGLHAAVAPDAGCVA